MCDNFQSSASCDVDINQSVADDYSSEPAPYLPRTELQEVLLPQVGSRSTRPHIRLLWAKCLLLQARRRLLKQLLARCGYRRGRAARRSAIGASACFEAAGTCS